ncbi:hypothetical protein FACS1894109_04740 [Spirochaetia bacterium]|nr:hypothetical protein FACS1894109_04740 [Spirochaetia bacterium]
MLTRLGSRAKIRYLGQVMKRIFIPFFRTYLFFLVSLFSILIVLCIYFYRFALNNSIAEGYSHLATRIEILEDDFNRMSALINNLGAYEMIIQAATRSVPLRPVDRYTLERARRELVNGVSGLSNDIIADYGIIFQNRTCITARRIFDSADDCFGYFIYQHEGTWVNAEDLWETLAGPGFPGTYYTPEWGSFSGMIYADNMRTALSSYRINRVFFVINTDVLLQKWITNDITRVELKDINNTAIASYGIPVTRAFHSIEYTSPGGIRVIAYLPQAVIIQKMRAPIVFTVIIAAFFLFIGLSLVFYLSYRNTIHLRGGMFERLLNGLIYTQTEWDEATDILAAFPPLYCLCLIRFGEMLISPSKAHSEVNQMIRLLGENLDHPLLTHHIGDDKTVILLPLTEKYNEPEGYKEILERIIEQSLSRRQLILHIALSGILKNKEHLQEGYRQVCQILRMVTTHTPSGVFIWDQGAENSQLFPLEFTDSQRLYELLLAADFEHASIMVRRAFASLDWHSATEPVLYHLFWSFEQVFIRIKGENILNDMGLFTPPDYSASDTVEDLLAKILAASERICEYIKSSNKQKETRLSLSLMAYIDKKTMDPTFCIAMAASEFGLSEDLIQNLIHRSAGKTFFEYVDQKRMKKAYDLLLETDKTVNDIALECGFALVNSFYKAFKRYFGYAPSTLRVNRENS